MGREKVRIEGGAAGEGRSRVQLDFNSVAKGYVVDLLAALVEKYGAENYIVDVGGEVRCRGVTLGRCVAHRHQETLSTAT